MNRILGLSAYHADASAAAVEDGRFLAGVEEERFRRIKHWAGFPELAVRFCLEEMNGGDLQGVTALAVARQPKAYLARKALLALSHPRSLRRALGRARNLRQVASLEERIATAFGGPAPKLYPVEHHLAHVASAFYCSPFDEAMCLTVDGFGDFVSTMLAVGRGNAIEVLDRVHFPHSLGLFYTAVTQFLGFPGFGDEYKVMGLAAYGEAAFADPVGRMVPPRPDGTFALDLRYFRHLSEGVDMTWEDGSPELGLVYTPALAELLGPPRRQGEELTQRHKDLAASLQKVYEDRFFALVQALQRRTGLKRLALAGGCAMNSLANGRLFDRTDVEEVFIQSAAGDAGTSLGAALYVHHAVLGAPRNGFVMEHSYWGPRYGEEEIRRAIAEALPASAGRDGVWGEIRIETIGDEARLADATAEAIAAGAVVGWYQGRSEWGPRALGNRSILADPRRADMKDVLNLKIKRRESFRPFAPSILEERTGEWFTIDYPDPFMIKVYPIRPEKRPLVPAVTHADGTGRLQTVSRRTNPRYWRLIRAFEERTGVPMVVNTSFNENEPIVNTPAEALDCFLRTRMDRLVLGDIVLSRERLVIRSLLERLSRGRVLRRRLPEEHGGHALYVSPDAAMKLWQRDLAAVDPFLLTMASRLVRPEMTVWDVGANVGLFAFAAAFAAGRSGHVLAVEADAWLAGLIERSAREAPASHARVEVLAAAVAEAEGVAELCIARRGRAGNHLRSVPGSTQTGGTREVRQVTVVTLDSLLDGHSPPQIVKIDIEGAELLCLLGAGRLLREVRPVLLCEVTRENAAAVGELLHGQGYTLLDANSFSHAPLDRPAWNTLALPG